MFGSSGWKLYSVNNFRIDTKWDIQNFGILTSSRVIASGLKISFGYIFVSIRVFEILRSLDTTTYIQLYHEKNRMRISITVLEISCAQNMRTDRRTLAKSVSFLFLIKNIYTFPYLSCVFKNVPHPLTKLSIPFFSKGNVYKYVSNF